MEITNSNVTHITSENFDKIMKSKKTVIIDFWAEWCGPCKMMGPVFEVLSKEVPEISFAKINIDENENLANNFGIMSIPTLVLVKNGKEVNRISGFMPKEELKRQIKAML